MGEPTERLNYKRVGEFDLGNVPDDEKPSDCPEPGMVKSVVCFEISPAYRGRGIASKLLERVCLDAKAAGYAFVEAYPKEQNQDSALAFTGPMGLYEKFGFREWTRRGSTIVMRKSLK